VYTLLLLLLIITLVPICLLIDSFLRTKYIFNSLYLDSQIIKNTILVQPRSLTDRISGLRNYPSIDTNTYLLLKTKSIHTIGMHFPITIIYLKKNGTILEIKENIKPNKFIFKYPHGTHYILEMSIKNTIPFDINSKLTWEK
jgi:uncharacterized membrane protein (UPF0127 family)